MLLEQRIVREYYFLMMTKKKAVTVTGGWLFSNLVAPGHPYDIGSEKG